MKNCKIFEGLSKQEINLAKEQLDFSFNKYKKDQVIIEENSIVKEIGIINKGNLCISKFTEDGREILMQKLLPSYIIGAEIAFTRKQDSPYSVYASEDTEIGWFSIDKVMGEGFLNEDIKMIILKNIMYFIADENIRKYYKIEAISTKGVRNKIMRYLHIQQKKEASNSLHLKFNREELANFLGINRSVLSNELSLMEDEGMIKLNKNYLKIIKLT